MHGRSIRRLVLTYIPPVLAWLLTWPAAAGLYLGWGRHGGAPTTLVALALLIFTAAGWKLTQKLSHARSRRSR